MRPKVYRKKEDMPTTNELINLINNLKLTKPTSCIAQNNSITQEGEQFHIGSCMQTESRSQYQSVIEDDFDNYQCFEEIER
jgi:hypothetical protein